MENAILLNALFAEYVGDRTMHIKAIERVQAQELPEEGKR